MASMSALTMLKLCFIGFVLIIASAENTKFHISDQQLQSDVQETLRKKTLTLNPLNIAALVGDTVTLRCEVDSPPPSSRVMWTEFVTSPSGTIISDGPMIISNHPNAARYSISQPDEESNQFYLEIRDVVLEDGGTYACHDILDGTSDHYDGYAELIILELPVCSATWACDGTEGIVIEDEGLYRHACTVHYRGGIAPALTWSGPEPFTVRGDSNSDSVSSTLTFVADRSMNDLRYVVRTNFTQTGRVRAGAATNVPDLDLSTPFPSIIVYWAPKNIVYAPIKDVYQVGDTITCQADSRPLSFYQWEDKTTGEIFSTQTFTITADMAGETTTLICTALNFICGIPNNAVLTVDIVVADQLSITY